MIEDSHQRKESAEPRVVFFNPALYAIGGMQAWLATLLPDLRERGWRVWLALPDGPHNDASAYLANYPFAPCLRVVNPTRSRLGRWRSLQRALREASPDLLVVAHLVSAYPAIADLRARGRAAPRVVASFHAQSSGLFADLQRHRGVIDAVVAPNRLLAAAAQELGGVAPERVFLGPYGVEVPPLETPPVPPGPIELVFAHRLEDGQKRLRDLAPLLDALGRRGVEARLEVVGSGPDEDLARGWLARHVEAGRARFTGPVPPAELRARAMHPPKVFLVTSAWENGPIVALQAVAWGLPLVSSRYVGAAAEGFLRDGETALLFPVGDVEVAADQVARLREPRLRASLARSAWQALARRYARPVAAAAWDAALRAVLELPRQPVPPRPRAEPAGRLDRLLGVGAAEWARRTLRWPVEVHGPGDEWPHTEGGGVPESELEERLRRLDLALAAAQETA